MKYQTNLLERYLDTFGMKLEKEFKFCINRKFKSDYAILPWRLLIEIDGGCWQKKSRHFYGTGAIKDMEKNNLAMIYGFQVLHFTPEQFRKTQCVEWLEMWRKNRGKCD